jgi:hypothetical protein
MDFVPSFDEISYPVDSYRGAAVSHEKQSHRGIMPYSSIENRPEGFFQRESRTGQNLRDDLLKMNLWFSRISRERVPDLGVRARVRALVPPNPGIYHGNSQRTEFIAGCKEP